MNLDYSKYTALVLDLDGTLIETLSGCIFPKGVYDMRINWDVFEAIQYLLPNVRDVLIASNQSGISKGLVNEQSFRAKILYVAAALKDYLHYYNQDIFIDVRYSKNARGEMRKPNTGMLTNSQMSLMPKETILFIGDATDKKRDFSDSDKRCAENFGVDYRDVRDFIKDYKLQNLMDHV